MQKCFNNGEKMGRLIFNPCKIIKFDVRIVKEDENSEVIHLTIETEDDCLKYRICSDKREPDLSLIQRDLNAGLAKVLEEDADVEIREYMERDYLFVRYPDGTSKQYTAQKI